MGNMERLHGAVPIITAANVDLSNCDREQVQYSGAVQPHGALLVLSEPELRIVQASANTASLLGAPSAAALQGGELEPVFGEAQARALRDRLARDPAALDNGPMHVLRAELPGGLFDAFAHRVDGVIILELERGAPEAAAPLLHLYSDLQAAIAQLQATASLQAFFDLAVQQIRRFTGYDRVMAYKFLEDSSGQVIAEAKAGELESFLGLRYPSSDVPAPARRLFALKWLRHLPDTGYEPVPLVPEMNPVTGGPLDMSRALLRSVSVMYTGYLRNMGVGGATVMPLMKEGQLWGLVSCQHNTPRHLPHEVRMATEFLAHMLSLLMAAKDNVETYEYRLRIGATLNYMVRAMAGEAVFQHGLTRQDADLLALLDAGGAALAIDGELVLMGHTPAEDQVRALLAWLDSRAEEGEEVFATDRLSVLWPEAAAFQDTGAGVLAARLVQHRPDYVLWFRPEMLQTVNWAGNPNKPVEVSEENGEIRLSPRGSFALYRQSVQGLAKPWHEVEVQAAGDLRRAIVEVILRHAGSLERTNRELAQSNVELDSFAYVASHDLKEPLRGIHNYASLLARSHGESLNEEGRSRLDTVLRLTRRMDDLIESLLHYSRVGRVELAIAETDLDDVLDEVATMLQPRLEAAGTELRRPRPLPRVRCDRVRIREVFVNLLDNALKYNDKPERWIEVGWEEGAASGPVFHVSDNGLGIALADQERIFQIFKRLHGRGEHGGGSGVGLTIVRRMVERHGGQVWVESALGQGTTFRFTLGSGADGAVAG